MALSGTAYSNKRGGWQLKMTWTGTQNITANTTAIHWTVALVADATWRINATTAFSGSITVNGAKTTFSKNPSTAGGTTMTLGSGTTTVGHNSDGTKSTTIAFSYYLGIYSGSLGGTVGTLSGSSAVSLNTIPRASTMAWVAADSPHTFGKTQRFTVTAAVARYYHSVELRINGVLTATLVSNSQGGGTKSLVLPLDLMNKFPNSAQATGMSFRLITHTVAGSYGSGSLIGYRDYALSSCNFPDDVVPTITSVTHTETITSPNIATVIGGYVQGYSILALATVAAGAYSSTIKSYTHNLGGVSYTGQNVVTGIMTTAGDIALKTTITDSRGRTASMTQTVTVLAYTPPTISLTLERSDEAGEPLDEGTFADVNLKGTTTPLNDRNGQLIVLEYAVQGTDTWTRVTHSINTYTYDTHVLVPGMDIDRAYIFRVSVQDTFQTVSSRGSIPTAFTTVDYRAGGRGVAFGQVATQDGVWVGKHMPLNIVADPDETGSGHVMTVKANTGLDLLAITIDANGMLALNGRALIDMFYPVGTVYESTAPENPSTFIGGEWERFGNGRVTVGVDENDANFKAPSQEYGSGSQALRAWSGAVSNAANTIGYKTEGAVTGSVYTYYIHGTNAAGEADAQKRTVNHSTRVTQTNAADATTYQPSIAVYRWHRTA